MIGLYPSINPQTYNSEPRDHVLTWRLEKLELLSRSDHTSPAFRSPVHTGIGSSRTAAALTGASLRPRKRDPVMTTRIPPLTVLKHSAELAEKVLSDKLDFSVDYGYDVDEKPGELVLEIGKSNRLHGRMKAVEVDEGQQWDWRVCAWVNPAGAQSVPSKPLASGRTNHPHSAMSDMVGELLAQEFEVQMDEVQSTDPSLRIAELD